METKVEAKAKVNSLLKIENGNSIKALREFLKLLMDKGVVEYLLVPQEISQGSSLAPTLIKEPAQLDNANPFSPVMPVSSAAIVSRLTADKPGRKLGVVMKPCEIRAFIELVKLQQANTDNLTIIGVDCPGTFEVEDYKKLVEKFEAPSEEKASRIFDRMRKSVVSSTVEPLPAALRTACSICNVFTPTLADITIGFYGLDEGILINLEDKLAGKLGLDIGEEIYTRDTAINDLVDSRNQARENTFSDFRDKMKSIVDFAGCLDTCIRCYACSTACPLCYCRVCFLRTDTFRPESERYYRWVDNEGAVRMPSEILLYHLTRLSHVAASCCGCGMCESACPRNLPLTSIFQTVGSGLQKTLEYTPGKSLDDKIPLATFREVES